MHACEGANGFVYACVYLCVCVCVCVCVCEFVCSHLYSYGFGTHICTLSSVDELVIRVNELDACSVYACVGNYMHACHVGIHYYIQSVSLYAHA